MKKLSLFIIIFLIISITQGCSKKVVKEEGLAATGRNIAIKQKLNERTIKPEHFIDLTYFQNVVPQEWGENVTGVKTRIKTDEKKFALTFDACGGDYGNEYDEDLISYLIEKNIPATLFVNERWIVENENTFIELSSHPLFQIENHGTNHSPLSVNSGEA